MTKKILLVDDDENIRSVLREALAQEGYGTVEAHDGEQGVARALAERPDLVISDIVMPTMDGWELCQTLRSLPSTKTVPFIFLSSLDKTPEKILAARLGADDYLSKPFNMEHLMEKVGKLAGRLDNRHDVLEGKETSVSGGRTESILVDTIEFLRATGRTGVVAVRAGNSKGVVYLEKGRLVHAVYRGRKGEGALLAMLRLESSQITFKEGSYPDLKANFRIGWQEFMTALTDMG